MSIETKYARLYTLMILACDAVVAYEEHACGAFGAMGRKLFVLAQASVVNTLVMHEILDTWQRLSDFFETISDYGDRSKKLEREILGEVRKIDWTIPMERDFERLKELATQLEEIENGEERGSFWEAEEAAGNAVEALGSELCKIIDEAREELAERTREAGKAVA